jgi:hypothetical protein
VTASRLPRAAASVLLLVTATAATAVALTVATVALTVALVAGTAAPASAHSADPRVRTTLSAVEPALPAAVVVQVQASLAAQLVADNPTPTPLEVLGLSGEPFLRLSSAGVEADVTSEDFLSTSSPTGAVPPEAGRDEPPRWVRISAGSSWGWFDHRLHPDDVTAPADVQRRVRLSTWEVPLRYGGRPHVARGSVDVEPLLGAFVVTADPAAAPLAVQALPGRLPGVFLSNPERRPFTVLGVDGEPFLRFGPAGVEVNTASRTHVEDRQARGEGAGPPSPEPRFELVDAEGTSYTWLDVRLRYRDDLPPDDALRADGPVVVDRWEVPVEGLEGVPALTGEVRWVPEQGALEARDEAGSLGGRVPGAALLAGAGLAVVLAVLLVRRRRNG